jgi:GldM C-terminal domain
MKSIGKDQFTTRILRIAGITPKNNNTIGWPILLALPLLLLLISPDSTILATSVEKQPETGQTPMIHRLPTENKPTKPEILIPQKPHPATTISFTDSLPESVIAIVPEKMNVLYIGVDNPVTIAVAGYKSGDLIVRQADEKEGLTISKLDNGHYNVTATKPGQAGIKVYVTENGIEKSIGTKWFRIKRIPDPKLTMEGLTSRVITGEKLLACKSVMAIIENFDFDASCEVSGYNVTILPKGGEPTNPIRSTSGIFSGELLKLFEGLAEKGGTIFFDDIKVSCPGDTNPRNLGGLAFKVKGRSDE